MKLENLSDQDINNIMTGLGNLPLIQVQPTWAKVMEQIQEQQKQPEPPADFPKAVPGGTE